MTRDEEHATVSVVLAARQQYLAAGANPLKHWDQIETAMRRASASSVTLAQWITRFSRRLLIAAPSKLLSSAIAELRAAVADGRGWIRGVEEEAPFLIASARVEAERIADEKKLERELERAKQKEQTDG